MIGISLDILDTLTNVCLLHHDHEDQSSHLGQGLGWSVLANRPASAMLAIMRESVSAIIDCSMLACFAT